jgi:hypothetical protein
MDGGFHYPFAPFKETDGDAEVDGAAGLGVVCGVWFVN